MFCGCDRSAYRVTCALSGVAFSVCAVNFLYLHEFADIVEKPASDDPVQIDFKRHFFVGRDHRLGYTQSPFRDRDSVLDQVYAVSRSEKRERDFAKLVKILPAAIFRAVSPHFDNFFSQSLVLHLGKKLAESLFKFFFHLTPQRNLNSGILAEIFGK